MKIDFTFPFGQRVHAVQQTDRRTKKVFVLGVYASAVHATWLSPSGKTIVRALAIASEPYIFWRGENAQEIISKSIIPAELGSLNAAGEQYNGPSGKCLDELFLGPLGVDRADVWLCDLLPETRLNPAQLKALKKYDEVKKRYQLPDVTIPKVPIIFAEDTRRQEIIAEIRCASPKLIVLLGDQPIRWFLSSFTNQWRKLADFKPYGKVCPITIDGKDYNVLPLVHPRQAAGLGSYSADWNSVHRNWTKNNARQITEIYD